MLQKRAVSIICHAAAYNYITLGGAIRYPDSYWLTTDKEWTHLRYYA